ncbi:MAG: HAD-IIIC family phosphatase [Myxococcales bacterium]|nr:HAD-IIIC family phosphatase [Myxococcales bacterium]
MMDFISDSNRLRKAGQLRESLDALRIGLRPAGVDAAAHERAGRLLKKHLDAPNAPTVRLLGQCTTSWMVPVLGAVAWGRGLALRVEDGEYDSVLQELAHGDAPDVLILIPWTQRLFSDDARTESERIDGELAFWQAAWAQRKGSRLVQVGYDWTAPGPSGVMLGGGAGGPMRLVRRMNDALRHHLPPGAAWVDLEAVSGALGRERFYDARRFFWTKQPFSEDGALRLCRHLFAAARALLTGPKKVLVLDLDNTLWGGVVGELGPYGVQLGESADGEAFRAFQAYCKGLAARGVVLVVASKNNDADAREPFEKNPDMVLRLGDFAAFEANWAPKSHNIARMAETLRLGLDSFVFFDDNPAEREQVRQALPQVEVVDVPEDPAEYVAALEATLFYESLPLTAADAERGAQYQAEAQRDAARTAFGSLDAYLTSLEMVADLRAVDDGDMQRVVQLLGKTNQFNLTTRRHGDGQLREWLADGRSILYTLRVRDRFGDHGLIGVVLGVPEEEGLLRVDTLLMSCRVIGRTVEQYLWARVIARARDLGYRRIRAEFLPTAKNAQVARLYDEFGLRRISESDGAVVYEADLDSLPPPRSFLRD